MSNRNQSSAFRSGFSGCFGVGCAVVVFFVGGAALIILADLFLAGTAR